jgi:uncharacterized tellurite resistance protein B-like protein
MIAGRRTRQVALLKVLAAASWADGRLDNEEMNRIKELILAYGLEPADVRDVYALLDAPVSYSRCEELTRELLSMLATRAEREEVLHEIEALFRADTDLEEGEREMLVGLRGIMEAMDSVDHFVSRIGGVFKRVFAARDASRDPGQLTRYLKNTVLQRLHDVSGGAWHSEADAATLNRYTLFGAVLGKVADVDDGMSEAELARIRALLEERFSIHPPLLDWVVQSVSEAASARMDRQGLLSEFNRIAEMDARMELLDASFAVAAVDGTVSATELEELRLLANFLWIDPRDFNAVRQRWA